MSSEHHSHPVLIRTLGVLLTPLAAIIGLGLGLGAQAPLHAAVTPAAPVPSARWSSSPTLQPDTIIGDSTSFTGHSDPHDGNTLFYNALDIEGNYLYTATGQGMQVIDLSPASGPLLRSYLYGWISGSAFPIWNYSDKDWYIKQIDAPEGDTSVVTLGMEEQGFAIVRTTDPSNAVVAYQREEPTSAVYAFTSGGTKYGYGLVVLETVPSTSTT